MLILLSKNNINKIENNYHKRPMLFCRYVIESVKWGMFLSRTLCPTGEERLFQRIIVCLSACLSKLGVLSNT